MYVWQVIIILSINRIPNSAFKTRVKTDISIRQFNILDAEYTI
ncbi:MAG: hypothetical protein UZ09_BCD002000835 [Bacteroidetes bacterium OLB9]|nr:MAG: hypothetical protein UZ09_BCD002000835 [Bacteroidetes bacterium OLB9]